MRASAKRAAEEDEYEDEFDDYSEPTMRLSQAFIVVLILHVVAVGGVFAFNMMKTRNAAAARTAPVSTASSATPSDAAVAAATPAPTAAPVARVTPRPRPEDGIHEVQAGETLTRIANLYGVSIAAIEAENGLASQSHIRAGQRLRIPAEGSTAPVNASPRTAPSPTARPETVAKATPAPSAAPVAKTNAASAGGTAGGDVYVVAKGDNPYSIAKKLKVSYTELLKVNAITDPTKLQIGQKLKIPAQE